MFKARSLEKTMYTFGEPLVFTNVYREYGKGYNPTNGSFVAPANGTYLIGITLCLRSGGCVVGIANYSYISRTTNVIVVTAEKHTLLR